MSYTAGFNIADYKATIDSYADARISADSTIVKTSGNQTIGGTKTFSSHLSTPISSPTQDSQATNKRYVDAKPLNFVVKKYTGDGTGERQLTHTLGRIPNLIYISHATKGLIFITKNVDNEWAYHNVSYENGAYGLVSAPTDTKFYVPNIFNTNTNTYHVHLFY